MTCAASPCTEGAPLPPREFTEDERFQIALWFLRGRQAMQRAALRELSPPGGDEALAALILQENTTP